MRLPAYQSDKSASWFETHGFAALPRHEGLTSCACDDLVLRSRAGGRLEGMGRDMIAGTKILVLAARIFARVCQANRPQIEGAQGMPDARCTRSRLCGKKHSVSNQGYTATAGIPCTMVLTGSFVLSSVTCLVATSFAEDSATLAPASERQDHTTSPSAKTLFVPRNAALNALRPSHPAPTSVTIASAPLAVCRMATL